MPVLLVVSQTNPPRFEHHRGAPLFDKEADAETLDAVVVDALVADTEVLDPEVADGEVVDAEVVDTELADAVVELFHVGTALNAVPIPNKEDAAFLDKEAEDLNAIVGRQGIGTLSTLKLSLLSSWWTGGHGRDKVGQLNKSLTDDLSESERFLITSLP
jgi:hypothetical protein